jgi:hypothetical protein
MGKEPWEILALTGLPLSVPRLPHILYGMQRNLGSWTHRAPSASRLAPSSNLLRMR